MSEPIPEWLIGSITTYLKGKSIGMILDRKNDRLTIPVTTLPVLKFLKKTFFRAIEPQCSAIAIKMDENAGCIYVEAVWRGDIPDAKGVDPWILVKFYPTMRGHVIATLTKCPLPYVYLQPVTASASASASASAQRPLPRVPTQQQQQQQKREDAPATETNLSSDLEAILKNLRQEYTSFKTTSNYCFILKKVPCSCDDAKLLSTWMNRLLRLISENTLANLKCPSFWAQIKVRHPFDSNGYVLSSSSLKTPFKIMLYKNAERYHDTKQVCLEERFIK